MCVDDWCVGCFLLVFSLIYCSSLVTFWFAGWWLAIYCWCLGLVLMLVDCLYLVGCWLRLFDVWFSDLRFVGCV